MQGDDQNSQPPAKLPRLYSKQELTRIFGVSTASIDGWARKGLIPKPAAFVGKRPYWDANALLRTIRRRQVEDAARA